jgi:hypothetical protein
MAGVAASHLYHTRVRHREENPYGCRDRIGAARGLHQGLPVRWRDKKHMADQPTRGKRCDTCGKPLQHLGARSPEAPRDGWPHDQVFVCPDGHEHWEFDALALTWRKDDA